MAELLPLTRLDGDIPAFVVKVRGRVFDDTRVIENASEVIEQVRKGGDRTLRELTEKFDGAKIREIRVSKDEIEGALKEADPALVEALRFSLDRVGKTQAQLLKRLRYSYASEGFVVRLSPKPYSSVGCYVPGGRAAYASTVLMTAGVAKIAGVERVAICSPPAPNGKVDPAILAAAAICGVDEVYSVGGAQAVAALAYGTESIKKVEKIVGPGGLYAAVAKKLVSSDVPIDFFAGPTEIIVVGDLSTDTRAAAWDLVGQAEHGEETMCGFVTWDRKVAAEVRAEAARIAKTVSRREYVQKALSRGFVALCRDRAQALELVNEIAPEHLEVLVEDAREFASEVRNAGLVLVGKFAPCAASDYSIGTDHVIPTGGNARIRSGLSVLDFVKLNWIVEGSRDGLRSVLPSLKTLANAEGLSNHYLSVESRFKKR
jgi:histidinol dehydrogenase